MSLFLNFSGEHCARNCRLSEFWFAIETLTSEIVNLDCLSNLASKCTWKGTSKSRLSAAQKSNVLGRNQSVRFSQIQRREVVHSFLWNNYFIWKPGSARLPTINCLHDIHYGRMYLNLAYLMGLEEIHRIFSFLRIFDSCRLAKRASLCVDHCPWSQNGLRSRRKAILLQASRQSSWLLGL